MVAGPASRRDAERTSWAFRLVTLLPASRFSSLCSRVSLLAGQSLLRPRCCSTISTTRATTRCSRSGGTDGGSAQRKAGRGSPRRVWSPAGISFAGHGNRLLRLISSTDGTGTGTTQAQVCQQRKFYEGTYATRVRFNDVPDSGPDGDQIVETFYAISPLEAPLDPNYSELDWEYLPNGGWNVTDPTLFVTSWSTAQLVPYISDNTSTTTPGSLNGWHTLVYQVANGTVDYYLDGTLIATHGGKYYPNVPMAISYNLWFIQGGQLPAGSLRSYHEDIDWVYYQVGGVLSPQQVTEHVAILRRQHVTFRNTVPPESPPLNSPCNF